MNNVMNIMQGIYEMEDGLGHCMAIVSDSVEEMLSDAAYRILIGLIFAEDINGEGTIVANVDEERGIVRAACGEYFLKSEMFFADSGAISVRFRKVNGTWRVQVDVIEELRDELEGRINDMIRGYNDGKAIAEALEGE